MATSSAPHEKSSHKRSRQAGAGPQSRLRAVRVKRGFTQTELARLSGMHRNSIRNLENGTTHEVTSDNAAALAKALKTSIDDLDLRVRANVEARSVRFRRLSPEQRQLVDELLSLPPEDYAVVRGAIERLRRKKAKKPRRGGRR